MRSWKWWYMPIILASRKLIQEIPNLRPAGLLSKSDRLRERKGEKEEEGREGREGR
jgi:hypothetical protein